MPGDREVTDLDDLDELLRLVDPPANRDENSRAAAARIRQWANSRNKRAVLRAIVDSGSQGMTNDEIEVALGQLHQTVSPIVWALYRLRLIRRVGKRPTRSRRQAHVYVFARIERAGARAAVRPVFGRPETGRL